MSDVVAVWFGFLLGLIGIGVVMTFVVRFLQRAGGGLR